jgi:hypothetical protein
MNCCMCGALIVKAPGVTKKLVCSRACAVAKRVKMDKERYSPLRTLRNQMSRHRIDVKIFKMKDCLDLPPPSRAEKERMMEGLHRLLFTPADEVSLLFSQAQNLGRGVHYKGTEVRL